MIKNGMASLIKCLQARAPATYTFDAPVKTIDTTRGDGGVTVYLKDGGQMSAAFIVVTVPLGVLQRVLASYSMNDS